MASDPEEVLSHEMTESPALSLLKRLAKGDKSALADFYDLHAGLVKDRKSVV